MLEKDAKRERRKLETHLRRGYKEGLRAKLKRLDDEIKAARKRRNQAVSGAVSSCKSNRAAVNARIKQRREQVRQQVNSWAAEQRADAAQTCAMAKKQALSLNDDVQRLEAVRKAERAHQEHLRVLDANARDREQRRLGKVPKAQRRREQRTERDDAVRVNLAPHEAAIYDKIKGTLHTKPGQSRTEAFREWLESHEGEAKALMVADADRKLEELLRERERTQKELRHFVRVPKSRKRLPAGQRRKLPERAPPRRKYTAEELAEVPF